MLLILKVRDYMATFCKNCGAYVDETMQFCPDCGKQIDQAVIRYCPNCGEKLTLNEYFCRNCGLKLKEPKKESFLEKNKNLIIVLAVIAVIAVIAVGAMFMISPVENQEVKVDTISFNIPGDYQINEDLTSSENLDGVRHISKYWKKFDDYIRIDVIDPNSHSVDANDLLNEIDGHRENMMGYTGYYEETSDVYAFTFVKDNKVVSVSSSRPDVFDDIKVVENLN